MSAQLRSTALVALMVGAVVPRAHADDLSIPARCRPHDAYEDAKCEALIDARSAERNNRMNKRNVAANADVKARILASKTMSGDTVDSTLAYAARHMPFVLGNWHFVYARSGAEYAVLDYGSKPDIRSQSEIIDNDRSLLDDDLETDPVMSLKNSHAGGMAIWKVEGKSLTPWGSPANMLVLSPGAFVWAANEDRKGFDGAGYDAAIANDFSFFKSLDTGSGHLSNLVDPATATKLTFYWNVVEGYTVQADNLPCPSKSAGIFTVTGVNCAERAAAAKDVSGTVLPFKVIAATRSHGYDDSMVAADVSVSVEGGQSADWIATAIFVAEHSIIKDVTFVTVSVFVPNPWGDWPPQHAKLLVKTYYAPDPKLSPWTDKWAVFGSARAGTLADIEYDKLSNDLIEDPDKVSDPNVRLARAERAARRAVIAKYGLPRDWTVDENIGLDGSQHDRDHVILKGPAADDYSVEALTECLTSEKGDLLIEGCRPQRSEP